MNPYDEDLDKRPSEHQTDTDNDLKEEEQRDVTAIQQSPINAPPTLQVPFRYMTMSQTTMALTIAVQTMTTGAAYNLS